MQILDFSAQTLIPIGDLHDNFKKLIYHLKTNHLNKNKQPSSDDKYVPKSLNDFERYMKQMKKKKNRYSFVENCVFAILGDSTFGMCKDAYYDTLLKKIQEYLEADNNYLVFIRGNHDDPSFYEKDMDKFKYDRIKFISDYTVLKTKQGNSLCIGGGISVDRTWRQKQMSHINRFKKDFKRLLWWDKENVQPYSEIIAELKENGLEINSILTHTFPIELIREDRKEDYLSSAWFKQDETLQNDIIKESQYLENLIKDLIANGNNIKWWAHGHYHKGELSSIYLNNQDILVIGLDELSNDCYFSPNLNTLDMTNRGYFHGDCIEQELKKVENASKTKTVKFEKIIEESQETFDDLFWELMAR